MVAAMYLTTLVHALTNVQYKVFFGDFMQVEKTKVKNLLQTHREIASLHPKELSTD